MALIAEDGSGVVGAESYGTIADIRARWTALGYDHSAYSDDTFVEQAARRATAWLEGAYRLRWPGTPSTDAQGLHFPATGATDIYGRTLTGVPTAVFQAMAEAAYREAVSPNSLAPTIVLSDEANKVVVGEKVGPGGIEQKYEIAESVDTIRPILTAVDSLLALILKAEPIARAPESQSSSGVFIAR